MRPAALDKAETLARYVQTCGARLCEFEVALTEAEAEEMMAWLPESGLFTAEFLPTLEADIAEARRRADPFLVLQHFAFSGLTLARAKALQ